MAKNSRSRARERKEQRERQRQQQRMLLIVGGIVVVVLVLGGLVLLSSLPAEAPISEESLERYENLQQSFTSEGFPVLGNPDAPVEVVEFSSFSCPACGTFHDTVFPQLLPRIERGEISFTFVSLQFSGNNVEGASRTAVCAGNQGEFWVMHDALFNWFGLYAGTAFQSNRLSAGIAALNLDVDEYNQCFRSTETESVLAAGQSFATQQNINATPTIQIDGVTVASGADEILAAIDAKGPFTDLVPGTIASEEEAPEEEATEVVEDEATEEVAGEATEAVEATEETEAQEEAPAEETSEAEAPEEEATEESE